MNHLRETNPELLRAEIAKFYKSQEVVPLADPETRKKLKAGHLKFTLSSKVSYTPATDLSQPTCVTRSEDRMFKSLANAPADEADFNIINPVTFLPDEALKAFVIQRYRESPTESSETMVTVSASDEVTLRRESSEIVIADSSVPTSGITDAVPGASVLKSQLKDLGESSETAAAAFGIAHEVLGGSMLNPHHEEPGKSSETMAADLSAQTTMV
nr:hypothetical protein [Tanacetum cinerariifolium]